MKTKLPALQPGCIEGGALTSKQTRAAMTPKQANTLQALPLHSPIMNKTEHDEKMEHRNNRLPNNKPRPECSLIQLA